MGTGEGMKIRVSGRGVKGIGEGREGKSEKAKKGGYSHGLKPVESDIGTAQVSMPWLD
jgi:hypothetical protein